MLPARRRLLRNGLLTLLGSRLAAGAAPLLALAPARESVLRNHTVWRDLDGNIIDCHEGCILRVQDAFFWYGRAYRGNVDGVFGNGGARFRCGFNCYRSTDLVHWRFCGPCLSYPPSGNDWLTAGTWHRPRVLYDPARRRYVLWFFGLHTSSEDYEVRDFVAVSSSSEGPFSLVGQAGPGIVPSGDLALFEDERGGAWIANGDRSRNALVLRLSPDLLRTEGSATVVLPAAGHPGGYEGVSAIRYRGRYIYAASSVRGLNPSDTVYAVAGHPAGPWRPMGLMSGSNTWHSQISSFFFLRESDLLLALCDQWLTGPAGERVPAEFSCQLWMPVLFDPVTGKARMRPLPYWNPWRPESFR